MRAFHQELTDFDGKTLARVINKVSDGLATVFVTT